jgi:hypothetical protein
VLNFSFGTPSLFEEVFLFFFVAAGINDLILKFWNFEIGKIEFQNLPIALFPMY